MLARDLILVMAVVAVLAEVHVLSGTVPDCHIIKACLANDLLKLFLVLLVEGKVDHVARQDLLFLEEPKLVLVDFLLYLLLVVD